MGKRGAADPRSDSELVQVCNHGDAAEAARAFGVLYERHKAFVIRVALRFVRDHDAALDVLQETFAYLLRRFPPTGEGLELDARLTTLLYPVAKNTALTLRRKAERFRADDDRQPDDLPSAAVVEPADLTAALEELSDERREVILLRFVDDLSLAEIATVLDIPLGTVKSRLHLAIRQLRNSPAVKKILGP